MKIEHTVQEASRIETIQKQYKDLKGNFVLSLQDLFNFNQFNLDQFCKSFSPHSQSALLTEDAKKFCERYGIWLPTAHDYISCALYLYPLAPLHRMRGMLNNLAIGYYLNDIMGRDIFQNLPDITQEQYSYLIGKLATATPPFIPSVKASRVEHANAEMLQDIFSNSTQQWFAKFIPIYSRYIECTHRDNSGLALSVDQYIEDRYITSGMGHIVLFIEYSEGDFLDWDLLESLRLTEIVNKLHRTTALIGALMNDFFSFEKEVIDNEAESNLIASIALNYDDIPLDEIIEKSAAIVRSLLQDYVEWTSQIRSTVVSVPFAQKKVVESHLEGLDRCVQASWLWQVYTRRYKRPGSIWVETTSK